MPLKLFKHINKDIDLFYTEEMIEEREFYDSQKRDIACWRTKQYYLEKNQDYVKIAKVNSRKTGLERKAILTAHGMCIKNHWFYCNEYAGYPIQHWIDEVDGQYNVLIIDVCNDKQAKISSEKSVVIHPNESISNRKLMQDNVQFDIYIPGIGYLDSYLFEEQLKQLQEK